MAENKEPAFLDDYSERREYRNKAMMRVAYIRAKEADEERNFEVRYVRDPDDPSLWRRTRIREYTKREKALYKKHPKPKLL